MAKFALLKRMEPTPIDDADKDKLLMRYSDLNFVDDISKLSCKRCGRVLIYHYVSECGHLFCKNCRRVMSEGKGWRCPKCKTPISITDKQKPKVEEQVYSLTVRCLNHRYGCKQIMTLRLIINHLGSCEDTKDANLPRLLYADTYSLEAVVHRLQEISEEMQQLKEKVSHSQETYDNFIQNFKETEDKQRSDTETKWNEFQSKFDEKFSDFQTEASRLQNQIDDNDTKMMKEFSAMMSKMEDTANHYANEMKRVEQHLNQLQTTIERKMRQADDNRRKDAAWFEQKMERLHTNLVTETTRSQVQIEERSHQKIKEMEEKSAHLKQQLDEIGIKLNELDRKVKDQLGDLYQSHVKATNDLAELKAMKDRSEASDKSQREDFQNQLEQHLNTKLAEYYSRQKEELNSQLLETKNHLVSEVGKQQSEVKVKLMQELEYNRSEGFKMEMSKFKAQMKQHIEETIRNMTQEWTNERQHRAPRRTPDPKVEEARQFIYTVEPLIEVVMDVIEKNKLILEGCSASATKENGVTVEDAKQLTQEVIEIRKMESPQTICNSSKCVATYNENSNDKKPRPNVCCDGCKAATMKRLFCQAFELISGNCKVCGCYLGEHGSIYFTGKVVPKKITDKLILREMMATTDKNEQIDTLKIYTENQLKKMDREKMVIEIARSLFAKFLKANPTNPEEYGEGTSAPEDVITAKNLLLNMEMFGPTIAKAYKIAHRME